MSVFFVEMLRYGGIRQEPVGLFAELEADRSLPPPDNIGK
jgi:hypothetical protein